VVGGESPSQDYGWPGGGRQSRGSSGSICSSELSAARQRRQFFSHDCIASHRACVSTRYLLCPSFLLLCACLEHHLIHISLVAASSPAPCTYVCHRRPFRLCVSALLPACLHPTLSIYPTQVQHSNVHPLLARCSRVCATLRWAGSRASWVTLLGMGTAQGAVLCGAAVDKTESTCQLCGTTEPTLSVVRRCQWHTVLDSILTAHHLAFFCSSLLVFVQCFSPIVTGSLPASIRSSCKSGLCCSAGPWVANRGMWVRLLGLAAGCGLLFHLRCLAFCDSFTARELEYGASMLLSSSTGPTLLES